MTVPLTPRVVVVVIDGLPVDLLDAFWDELP
jgi:predicted AlkP superfamily pyrophosphatase or phosphodiesterase